MMKKLLLLSLVLVLAVSCGTQQKEVDSSLPVDHENVIRMAQVVKVKPECLEKYMELHADSYAGVRHLLEKYNIRNFSIYLEQFPDGNWYEFAYSEYWGEAYEADMAKLSAEPENIKWLEMCDPMQEGITPEYKGWKPIKRVYFNY